MSGRAASGRRKVAKVPGGLAALAIIVAPVPCLATGSHGLQAMLDMPYASEPDISPDGRSALFVVARADWQSNRYRRDVYLGVPGQGARPVAVHPDRSAWAPRWAPDGRSFAYLGDHEGAPQVYLLDRSGQSRRLTNAPGGVIAFEWSPDGRHMALALPDVPTGGPRGGGEARFRVLRADRPRASLWLLEVTGQGEGGVRRLTGEGDIAGRSIVTFSVHNLASSFAFSPDGRRIAFTHASSLNILDAVEADVAVVDLRSGRVRLLGTTPSHWEEAPRFSPDGAHIVYSRQNLADFLADNEIVIVPADGGHERIRTPRQAAEGRALGSTILLGWTSRGLILMAQEGVRQRVYLVDPGTGLAVPVPGLPDMVTDFRTGADGEAAVLLGMAPGGVPEISIRGRGSPRPDRVSDMGREIRRWPAHRVEVTSWLSPDGELIEGILYTPANLARPAPLIVLAHGGPREVARPTRLPEPLFPTEHWLDRGAVVLVPNYRGSIGYGERFRRLTVANTGHAEAIDIDSGVEALVRRGLVDPGRVAIVGHSWGGYLAAFLATTSRRYRAAIVVAGISDNIVNYALSNAGVAERGYLQSSPWRARERWLMTSPLGHAAGARTPTLILHGEDDRVVPVQNAYLLDRALADVGAPVRTLIFERTGHSDFRPADRRAAFVEMIDWLDRYLFLPASAQ